MRLLDRYILRTFLEPFVMCFVGFIAIWLVFDLSGNLQDFLEAHASLKQVARFYATQLPQVAVISLPVGLLLALLFSLSRMSRSNEIISMLAAGRSVVRLLVPLMIIGLLATCACLALNYEYAPQAEAVKKVALEQITKGRKASEKRETVEGHLFRDRQNNRTWFVRKLREDSPSLQGVHITQQMPDGTITTKWYASRAVFDFKTKQWILNGGMKVDFNSDGDIVNTDNFINAHRAISGWSETPWRIWSSQLEAQNLSVPELRAYLKSNSDFPPVQLAPYQCYLQHRWAFPWQCFVVVFIASPMAIVYSRRGVIGGVAAAMLLYALLLLSTYLFLALGKGYRLNASVAAWLPNAVFLSLGGLLLYLRSTNRDLPTLGWRRR
jgi:LPS export ABC transporter permease LptG